MNIETVMDEIAERLLTAHTRVSAHPVDKPNPPHLIVSLPDITYALTYQSAMDRWEIAVVLVVGRVVDRTVRASVAPFVAPTGPQSVRELLADDGPLGPYESCDSVTVTGATPDVYTFNAIEYSVYVFTLDIAGDGA